MPIVSNPKVMMGKPTIAGTRITVESILERLAAGESQEQIVEANPRLVPEDIRAALDFAAQALHADVVYPLAGIPLQMDRASIISRTARRSVLSSPNKLPRQSRS
jgi:uncharacterized protein (DUF433 family)